jgi:hypothetical protein
MEGMTQYQWNILKRAVRERFDRPDHLMSLAAGRNAIREVAEQAMSKPSRKRRTRAARFLQEPPSERTRTVETDSTPSALIDRPDRLPPEDTTASATDDESPLNEIVSDIDPDDLDVDDWDVATSDT